MMEKDKLGLLHAGEIFQFAKVKPSNTLFSLPFMSEALCNSVALPEGS